MNEMEKAAYVAAFVDGEGHIGCHRTTRGQWSRSISVCNTDASLIDLMQQFLADLGIKTRRQMHRPPDNPLWAQRWTVYVAGGRESFEQFARLIPIQAPRKRESLRSLLESYAVPDEVTAARRNGLTTPCESCGTPVYASAAVRARGGGRFCTYACRGSASRRRAMKVCASCGNNYEVTPAAAERSRFCSRSCFGKSQAGRLRNIAAVGAAARWRK